MAIVANTFQTYASKGIREELSDIITRVAPEETPFISNVGKQSISNTFTEWQTQSLSNPNTSNFHVEGDETSYEAVTPTVRLGNYSQIMKRTFIISDTEEKVRKAGRASEINYQKVLKGVELRRDFEAMLLNNQGAAAGDGTTNPRKFGSVLAFIKTNTDIGATGANPVYTNIPTATRTDGTQRAFTETQLKNVLQQMFKSGAKTDMIMLGPVNKQKFSAFAGIAQQRRDTGNKPATIVATSDYYLSDFGLLSVVVDNFQRERDAILVDTDYVSIGTLRPYECTELAKTGDARKFMCIQEATLVVTSENALGLVADLTTTVA